MLMISVKQGNSETVKEMSGLHVRREHYEMHTSTNNMVVLLYINIVVVKSVQNTIVKNTLYLKTRSNQPFEYFSFCYIVLKHFDLSKNHN